MKSNLFYQDSCKVNFILQSQTPDPMTTGAGAPIADKINIQTVGPRGPALLQDVVFLDEMSHFDRERIPERVVHAKGSGKKFYHSTR